MSHFIVGVICQDPNDVEELLAPYNEQDEKYDEFIVQFESTYAAKKAYSEWRKDPQNAHRLRDYTFGTWMSGWHCYKEHDGKWGYYANPNAKWDWYQDGGRFDGFFNEQVKPGAEPQDSAHYLLRDYEFAQTDEQRRKSEAFWDEYVIGGEKEKYPDVFWRREYFTERYGTKENYLADEAYHRPYAFVTPDGVWHECGSMGWWGLDSTSTDKILAFANEWKDTVNDPQLQDHFIVWIDAHI